MPANLKELLVDELRDLYYCEKQLVKALPKLAKASTSPELRQAFESHLEETEDHVTRLEKAFEMLDEPVKAKTCHGILGIIEEGSELIKQHRKDKGPSLDAGLIAGGQRAEHYEMAAYGTLRTWAQALGEDELADLLSATLNEEKAADQKLSQLAETGINEAAQSGVEKPTHAMNRNADGPDGEDEDEDKDEGESSSSARSNSRSNGGAKRRPARMGMGGSGRSGQASRRNASRR
jgi:ferritin-like metal-binding protein YciE